MSALAPERNLFRRYAERSARHAKALNDSSIVIEMACGGVSVLFTGDLEREGLTSVLDRHDLDHVTILKVPHHGARSSFDRRWLALVHPDVAVFSAGAYNPYRHPASTVVDAYSQARSAVFRTDRDGAVWVDVDVRTSSFEVHRARDLLLHPVVPSSSIFAQEADNAYRLWRRWNWS